MVAGWSWLWNGIAPCLGAWPRAFSDEFLPFPRESIFLYEPKERHRCQCGRESSKSISLFLHLPFRAGGGAGPSYRTLTSARLSVSLADWASKHCGAAPHLLALHLLVYPPSHLSIHPAPIYPSSRPLIHPSIHLPTQLSHLSSTYTSIYSLI